MKTRQKVRPLDGALVRKGNVDVMFRTRESLAQEDLDFAFEKTAGPLTLFIGVEHIDEFYEGIRKKVQMVRIMETTYYGMREFFIQDVNDYILTFAKRG